MHFIPLKKEPNITTANVLPLRTFVPIFLI